MTVHYMDVELYSRPCKCDECPIQNIRKLSPVKMPESEVSPQTIMILFTKRCDLPGLQCLVCLTPA